MKEKQENPLVVIVILHWNRYEETKACLDSLRNVTYQPFVTVVVDNGSTDGSSQQLQDEYPEVHFLFNEKNLGFSAGNNVGIRYALAQNAQYVLLLNNDTIVSSDFLSHLVEAGENNTDAGVLSSTIYAYASGKKTRRIFYAGGRFSYIRATGIRFRLNEIDDMPNERSPIPVGYVTGCCMLIKKEVLSNVGLLSEDFFFGGEDDDFSWRVHRAGYQMLYVPQAVIWHKESSSRQFRSGEFYNAIISKAIFVRKHLPYPIFLLWWFIYSIRSFILLPRLVTYILRKHDLPPNYQTQIRESLISGLVNGFNPLGKSGFSVPE